MALFALVWVVLIATGTLLHQRVWVVAAAGGQPPGWQQRITNASHMAAMPGYAVLRALGHGWRTGGLRVPLFVTAVGWGFWLGLLFVALEGRRWLLRRELSPAVGKRLCSAAGPPDSSRRRFLVDVPIAAAGALPALGVLRGALMDPWDLQVARYTIPIRDLPPELDGLRLVQLSDTHLGPRVPLEFIDAAVQRALALRPDLFLLTGDYIDGGTHNNARAAAQMEPLVQSDRPVVGVLGNHDWYGDGRHMSRALSRVGVAMIDNRRTYLDAATRTLRPHARAGGSLCIAGIGDFIEDVVDVRSALGGVDELCPRLLLSHNPDAAEMLEWRRTTRPRVDLMISGHTHGGQVHVPLLGTPAIPSRYGQKYAGGLVQGPAFPVLISRGIGMSILPVRFGVPPELVEITLTRA